MLALSDGGKQREKEMQKVELFEAIRRDHALRGVSVRQLARTYRVGRRTVRQALASAVPPERQAASRAAPVLGAAKPFIDLIMKQDRTAPAKQRHTAHRIWERIRTELGIEVAESTVRKYVGKRKREIYGASEVMVPQVKEPGAEILCGKPHGASSPAGWSISIVARLPLRQRLHTGRSSRT